MSWGKLTQVIQSHVIYKACILINKERTIWHNKPQWLFSLSWHTVTEAVPPQVQTNISDGM